MLRPSDNCEGLARDPLWYKSGVIYEAHVRAFYDRTGDGTGDFRGLTQKLDYLKDLGVTAVWLLPFYPSPLKDDGYDIADYCDVHPMYPEAKAYYWHRFFSHQTKNNPDSGGPGSLPNHLILRQ